jgi:hypothetical protein
VRDTGAADPTQRWTVTVMLLVALASLPTLAAVSAGSATLGKTADPDGTTPFIAQPSDAPVVIVPEPPAELPPPPPVIVPPPPPPRQRPPAYRHRPESAEVHRAAGPRAPRSRPPVVRPSGAHRPPRCPPAALGWRPLSKAPLPVRAGCRAPR